MKSFNTLIIKKLLPMSPDETFDDIFVRLEKNIRQFPDLIEHIMLLRNPKPTHDDIENMLNAYHALFSVTTDNLSMIESLTRLFSLHCLSTEFAIGYITYRSKSEICSNWFHFDIVDHSSIIDTYSEIENRKNKQFLSNSAHAHLLLAYNNLLVMGLYNMFNNKLVNATNVDVVKSFIIYLHDVIIHQAEILATIDINDCLSPNIMETETQFLSYIKIGVTLLHNNALLFDHFTKIIPQILCIPENKIYLKYCMRSCLFEVLTKRITDMSSTFHLWYCIHNKVEQSVDNTITRPRSSFRKYVSTLTRLLVLCSTLSHCYDEQFMGLHPFIKIVDAIDKTFPKMEVRLIGAEDPIYDALGITVMSNHVKIYNVMLEMRDNLVRIKPKLVMPSEFKTYYHCRQTVA